MLSIVHLPSGNEFWSLLFMSGILGHCHLILVLVGNLPRNQQNMVASSGASQRVFQRNSNNYKVINTKLPNDSQLVTMKQRPCVIRQGKLIVLCMFPE